MTYSIEELKRIITPIARKYQIPVVYLFGSYARGQADENSDVDILIEREGSAIKSLFDLGAFYNELNETLGKSVDVVTTDSLNQPDAKRRNPWFASNICKERVTIYEGQ
ncbi:MAG: nucleotidyltransferase domain-containing protein [Oscillospiraceae bacterium]|nr:nucleotidyltransferase domain-containing protein [Oscillospiraceae bacterium]